MDKKKAVYVPTVGEEIGNAVSHGVMSLLSLLALPFAAVWAYAHDPGGVLASVSVSVFFLRPDLAFAGVFTPVSSSGVSVPALASSKASAPAVGVSLAEKSLMRASTSHVTASANSSREGMCSAMYCTTPS